MTGRERRLLRMLCMIASGGGGDKPWEEMTWDDVIAATKNGKYKDFEIGAMKELDLGSEGIVHMQIVGIDADNLADGSGKAPLTFISKELLKTNHRMNPALTPSSKPYNAGTGTILGWGECEMRVYLNDTIKPLIPQIVRGGIKQVTKTCCGYNAAGGKVTGYTTTDDVWIPSAREITGSYDYEISGPSYIGFFSDAESRKKFKTGASSAAQWWLRSAANTSSFSCISSSGSNSNSSANQSRAIALGFCL